MMLFVQVALLYLEVENAVVFGLAGLLIIGLDS
jgi:hypothetical protein